MKIKILYDKFPSTLETKINDFITDKKIKKMNILQGEYELICMIGYENV